MCTERASEFGVKEMSKVIYSFEFIIHDINISTILILVSNLRTNILYNSIVLIRKVTAMLCWPVLQIIISVVEQLNEAFLRSSLNKSNT